MIGHAFEREVIRQVCVCPVEAVIALVVLRQAKGHLFGHGMAHQVVLQGKEDLKPIAALFGPRGIVVILIAQHERLFEVVSQGEKGRLDEGLVGAEAQS